MKKQYVTPRVKKIDYTYDEQVVARSAEICSGVAYIVLGESCEDWRMLTPKAKSVDPCKVTTTVELT